MTINRRTHFSLRNASEEEDTRTDKSIADGCNPWRQTTPKESILLFLITFDSLQMNPRVFECLYSSMPAKIVFIHVQPSYKQ